jgi:predicted membrane protein
MNVNMGVGEIELNLNRLRVDQLDVSMGVGKITVTLPAKALKGKINCAIGETVLIIPRGAEAQIKVNAGITAVDMPSGFTHSGDVYTSAGYNNSGATRIELEVDQAIGNLRIEYGK